MDACDGETGEAPAPAESAGDAGDPGEESASAADAPDAHARGQRRAPAKRRRGGGGGSGSGRTLKGKVKAGRPSNGQPCPRCASQETKFCYFNNYNVKQPRFYCKVRSIWSWSRIA